MSRVTQSRADTVQNPPIWPAHAAAAPRRCRPVPHQSWSRSKFPRTEGVSEVRRLLQQQVPLLLPTAHGRDWSRGGGRAAPGAGDPETEGGRCAEDAGTGRGGGRERARGPGCGIRRASEVPQRRGEAGDTTRVRISLAGSRGADPRLGLRGPSLPGRPRQLQQPGSRLLAAPGPGSASARVAAQAARLLNESPAGPERCTAPPPRVTDASPAPSVRARLVPTPSTPRRPLTRGAGEGLLVSPRGRAALCRHLSRHPGTAEGCAGKGSAPSGLQTERQEVARCKIETWILHQVRSPLPVTTATTTAPSGVLFSS